MNRLFFRHDPERPNVHYPTLYVLQHDGHVFKMNRNLKQLAQKLEDEHNVKIIPSDKYYINEDETDIVKYKMVDTVDDILNILKDEDNDVDRHFLIHRDNDLEHIYFSLKAANYTPQMIYDTSITSINVEVNNKKFYIKNQQIVKGGLDGELLIDDEDTYNRAYQANRVFSKNIFKKKHLSQYSKQDIEILDTYKTTATSGIILNLAKNRVEIDVRKAYSAAMKSIKQIPVFTEFDIWKNITIKIYKI